MAVLHADGDTDYRGSTEVASGARWNRGDEPAVRKTPRADLDRFEQARGKRNSRGWRQQDCLA